MVIEKLISLTQKQDASPQQGSNNLDTPPASLNPQIGD